MKYHTIIWDWNGTLLNDLQLCLWCINTMLGKRGLPLLDTESYRRVFGFPVSRYYQRIGLDLEREPFADLAEEYMALYQPNSLSCPLQEGAAETLRALQVQGIRQVLLSASNKSYLMEQLASHPELDGVFSAIWGIDNIHAAGKTDLARALAEQEDLSCALMVGDTPHDAEVARAMKTDCVLLCCGHKDAASLHACGVPVLRCVPDVPFFVKESF